MVEFPISISAPDGSIYFVAFKQLEYNWITDMIGYNSGQAPDAYLSGLTKIGIKEWYDYWYNLWSRSDMLRSDILSWLEEKYNQYSSNNSSSYTDQTAQQSLGIIQNISHQIIDNEIVVDVTVYNPSSKTREYKVKLTTITGTSIQTEPDTYWKNIAPASSAVIRLSTNWNPLISIESLGNTYAGYGIKLLENTSWIPFLGSTTEADVKWVDVSGKITQTQPNIQDVTDVQGASGYAGGSYTNGSAGWLDPNKIVPIVLVIGGAYLLTKKK